MVVFRLAWRNIWRHTRRSLITASAMAGGVALCMAYVAVLDGMFADLFEKMVTKQTGHAQLHHPRYPKTKALFDTLDDAGPLERDIRSTAGVRATSARVYGFALLAVGETSGGGQLVGVHPPDEAAVRSLDEDITEGAWLAAAPEQNVVLGVDLAESLDATLGDELVVVTSAADGSLGNALYTVSGLLKTGSVFIDRSGAFIHREDAQELFALSGRVHEIVVLAEDKIQIDEVADALKAAMTRPSDADGVGGVLVRSWAEVSPSSYQLISMQDAIGLLLSLLIFGLAGLGILNTMLMSVFERTKELGVLIALGLKPRQVLAVILLETLLLTVIAMVVGLLLGGLLDWYLVTWGINWGTEIEFSGVSIPARMMGVVRPGGVVTVVLSLWFISFFAALWPAARAARLRPVVAMREET